MPRSRGSEMPQRQSPRATLQLRTSNSDSDAAHSTLTARANVDRSPKLVERRSPRNLVVEKKRGTCTSDLELQLGKAHDKLKKLKEQLASAELAKREAQEELEKARKQNRSEDPPEICETPGQNNQDITSPAKHLKYSNGIEDFSPETDVFEVTEVAMPVEAKVELVHAAKEDDHETSAVEECLESLTELENASNLAQNAEILELNSKLAEKERELDNFLSENENLRQKLVSVSADAAAARGKEEEMVLLLRKTKEELEEWKLQSSQLDEELKSTVAAKSAMEMEVTKMKVQSEQWRKAADAAAAVLAGDVQINGQVPERCGSMDKHHGPHEYTGIGSPMAEELDDGLGNGKKKGGGIRMFGDLWKKKGQK